MIKEKRKLKFQANTFLLLSLSKGGAEANAEMCNPICCKCTTVCWGSVPFFELKQILITMNTVDSLTLFTVSLSIEIPFQCFFWKMQTRKPSGGLFFTQDKYADIKCV